MREAVRKATEYADSLQCFFLLHSLGGGTGSGLGTYILGQLAEDYPTCLRFTASVFPSEDDGSAVLDFLSLPLRPPSLALAISLLPALVRSFSPTTPALFSRETRAHPQT